MGFWRTYLGDLWFLGGVQQCHASHHSIGPSRSLLPLYLVTQLQLSAWRYASKHLVLYSYGDAEVLADICTFESDSVCFVLRSPPKPSGVLRVPLAACSCLSMATIIVWHGVVVHCWPIASLCYLFGKVCQWKRYISHCNAWRVFVHMPIVDIVLG